MSHPSAFNEQQRRPCATARSDQFFSLQAVDFEHGRVCPVERGTTRADGVEPPRRASEVVFVAADEQSLGEPRSTIAA